MSTSAKAADTNRPDLEGTDGIAGNAPLATERHEGSTISQPKELPQTALPSFVQTGKRFTDWFNQRVAKLSNPKIRLGTKSATVVALHDDARLEVMVETESGADERQYVEFNATYLDMLLKKFAADGV